MPVSAYDAGGRLKKHALAGTSLAVDPDREKQRKQFGELHEEAVTAGAKGRKSMLGKLTQRYKDFGQPQQDRLAQIAEQKAAFEAEGAGLRDADLEGRFQEFEKNTEFDRANKNYRWRELHMPEEFLQEAKTKLKGMNWKERMEWGGDPDLFETEKGKRLLGTGPRSASAAFGGMGTSIGKDWAKMYWKTLGGKKLRQYYGGAMAKGMYDAKYGAKAQRAYEENFHKEVDRINESYIPLQEEEGQRQERLAERADMYNMFLGG